MSPRLHAPIEIALRDLRRAARMVLERVAVGPDGLDPRQLRTDWGRARKRGQVRHAEVERICRSIRVLLREGRYRFMLGKAGYLRRPGKKPRKHAILSIRDAIVIRTLADHLVEVWDVIPDAHVGGRPGVNGAEIAWTVYEHVASGGMVGRADIIGAYAGIPWRLPLGILARTIPVEICQLLERFFLVQERRFPGLVEGTAISPLLLALTLGTEVTEFVRPYTDTLHFYYDDPIWMGESYQLEAAGEALRDRLGELGLALHEEGPKAMVFTSGPFTYLGFQISPTEFIPAPESCASLLECLDKAIKKGACAEEKVSNGAKVIRGWFQYFARATHSEPFHDLDRKIARNYPFKIARDLPRLTRLHDGRKPHRGGRKSLRTRTSTSRDTTLRNQRHRGDSPPHLWVPRKMRALVR